MKPGQTFDTKGSMSVLLLGESGAGKSTLAMQWPSPFFCLSDRNIKFAAETANQAGKEWFFDYCDVMEVVDPKTKETATVVVPEAQRWGRSINLLMTARDNPAVKTLVDDGLTFLDAYLKAHIVDVGGMAEKPLTVGGERVMSLSLWSPYYNKLLRRIIDAKAGGKPYILCAHLSSRENDVTKVMEWKPAIGGEMRDKIGALFSEVWLLENEPVTVSAEYPRGVKQIIRTAPAPRIKILRTTVGLPPVFEPAKCEAFQALLKGL